MVKTLVGIQWDYWSMLELWIKKDRRSVDLQYSSYVIFSHCQCLTVFQLYAATLDNTGNNNTTCKMIEDIHVHQGLKWNSHKQQLPCVFILVYLKIHLNCLAVALDMLSTLGMLMLCPTSPRLQLLKMQLLSGNMTPHEMTTEF